MKPYIWRISACVLIVILLMIALLIESALREHERLQARLNAEFGFSHGSPLIRCGNIYKELFTIERVAPRGVFERVGFRSGDIITDMDIFDFYTLLERNRGRELRFQVVQGGNGPPLEKRLCREIRLTVPAVVGDSG